MVFPQTSPYLDVIMGYSDAFCSTDSMTIIGSSECFGSAQPLRLRDWPKVALWNLARSLK